MNKTQRAFTLIELMVAMAIVTILAAVILVQMEGYTKDARSSKALAQLSSAIPSMVSCWGNGNEVKSPSSGGAICKISGFGGADIAGYGYWSQTSGDLSSYSYGIKDVSSKNSWFLSLESSSDNKGVCCNSTLSSCKVIGQPVTSSNCTVSVPAN